MNKDQNDMVHSYNTGFIMLVSIVAALGGLLFGFDTAIISGTIPYIKAYFNLNEFTLGWAVSSILIGCVIGALFAGTLAELFGRRFVLIICAILFAVSGIGVALANVFSVFVFFRIVGGIGVGAAAMVSPMYIAEMAPTAWRGRLVALYQLAIVSGILLAYYSNYALVGLGENNWRWMFSSQILPALLFFIMLLLVPETPRWLIKKGRTIPALKILNRTGGGEFSQYELIQIQNSFQDETKLKLADLFSFRYAPIVWVGISLAVFQQITGINAIFYYAPAIFKETGIDASNSLLQTVAIGVVNVLSTFIAIGLVDKVGRRILLLTGSILMGLSLTAIALCFRYHYFDNYIVLIFLLIYVGAFCSTLGAVTWVYLSEIFPNRIRAIALSLVTLVLWLADFLVTYTFPIMTNKLGTFATLITYAVFCGIAFFYILLKVTETRGKSLEEIERSLIK
jgi:SP family arabinose:H+ symporter-like MFS transporter